MSQEQSLEELLEEAKKATGTANSALGINTAETKKGSGWGLKGFFNKHIYGDEEVEGAAPEIENESLKGLGMPEPIKFEAAVSEDDLGATSFEAIYEQAKVEVSACSIDDLEALSNSPEIASQPLNYKQMAVPFALKAKNLDISIPLADASKRDAALDGYAAMLFERAQLVKSQNTATVDAIQKEIEEFFKLKQEEMDALRRDSVEKERQFAVFMERKTIEERRMADIIRPYLNGKENPVSIGNPPQTKQPPEVLEKTA